MGLPIDSENGSGGSSFDGKITGWPEDSTLNVSIMPTERKEFILSLACDMYKNQNISEPKKQAQLAIEYAIVMYNALKQKGFLD